MLCPFCLIKTSDKALVCSGCSRDIVIPSSLIDERDDLAAKLETVRSELLQAKRQLELLKPRGRFRRKIKESGAHA